MMKTRAIMSSCRNFWNQRNQVLNEANNLLFWLSMHDATSAEQYLLATIQEEDEENMGTFQPWLNV